MARSVTLFRGGALVVALALVALLASSTRVAAAPPSVGFSSSINLSNSGAKSVYPVIAYDAAGKLHVAWLEYDADPAQTSRVMYTNNVNGSFLAPYQVTAKGGKNATHILAIAVETNRVHLFYTTDTKALRHTLLTLNGATPSPGSDTTLTPGGARGYAPSAIVDSAGRVQAAWIDNRSGQYQVYHRIWSNGGWEGSDRIVRATGAYQNFPSLAATNDGRVHVIYENNNTESYAYFDGSWRSSTNPGGGSPNQQYLASDGTTLYAVWSVTTSTHIVNFAQGVNGAWSGTTQLSDGGRWSDYPSITYNATNNKLYAFWAAGADGGNTSIVMREITPGGGMSDITTIGSGPSTWPRSASGPSGVSAVWQDKASGAEDVKLSTASTGAPPSPSPSPSPSPTPPPTPSGSLTVNNGAVFTNQAAVNVTISNTSSAPATAYSLADGTEPPTPSTPFNANPTNTTFNLNVADGQCRTHTVNGKLANGPSVSSTFSDSITYDPGVDAAVIARNPNLTYGSAPSVGAFPQVTPSSLPPANAGDPGYTPMNAYYLQITPGANECSGLVQYTRTFVSVPAPGKLPAPKTGPINGSLSMLDYLADPGQTAYDGAYTFYITVQDQAGNTRRYPDNTRVYQIILDSSAPAATLGANNIAPTTEVVDGLAQLNLTGLTIQDPPNPNNQYWGYWVVVKQTSAGAPTNNEWLANGVVFAGQASNPFRWNAASGMVGSFQPGANYTIYVRFLDYAGNASNPIMSQSFQINQLQGPRYFLPLVFR